MRWHAAFAGLSVDTRTVGDPSLNIKAGCDRGAPEYETSICWEKDSEDIARVTGA